MERIRDKVARREGEVQSLTVKFSAKSTTIASPMMTYIKPKTMVKIPMEKAKWLYWASLLDLVANLNPE
ncbi:hypothetical protein F0562_020508 [Nyssa sinensis]|uniref:Uncharacterized protein n=1 Tax=Nyssa sinensis TaxID=561372 RepID=A0A5J5BXN8_9ASTE|nr:hypothetical protein F0562_020508 [Nyssa sinensis]